VVSLNGKVVADSIKNQLREQLQGIETSQRPGLGTILVGDDPGSKSYVAGKHRDCSEVGINSIRIDLPSNSTDAEIFAAIKRLNSDASCTGFILQLPLPGNRNHSEFLEAIDPKKDCDGLHPYNLGRLVMGERAPRPCTPAGVIRLLAHYQVELSGAHVVIIGRGSTVGRPMALMLSDRSINATVSVVHTGTRNPHALIKGADVVIAALGKKWFVTREMVREGAVVVDVGLTRDGDQLYGDVDPAVSEVAGALSPVPRGVGPMTRAMLLENLMRIHRGDFQ
jgi:methylenetetrahydrofolate dehydrogenase (NADP+)/methenyltetrahydrofolate cyclohydrolase